MIGKDGRSYISCVMWLEKHKMPGMPCSHCGKLIPNGDVCFLVKEKDGKTGSYHKIRDCFNTGNEYSYGSLPPFNECWDRFRKKRFWFLKCEILV